MFKNINDYLYYIGMTSGLFNGESTDPDMPISCKEDLKIGENTILSYELHSHLHESDLLVYPEEIYVLRIKLIHDGNVVKEMDFFKRIEKKDRNFITTSANLKERHDYAMKKNIKPASKTFLRQYSFNDYTKDKNISPELMNEIVQYTKGLLDEHKNLIAQDQGSRGR